jgi:hypothetical protein
MLGLIIFVPVRCVLCRKPAIVSYRRRGAPFKTFQSWVCPYVDCRGGGSILLDGDVVSVSLPPPQPWAAES